MAWEYLTTELAGTATAEDWTTALNTQASAGWELLHLVRVEAYTQGENTWYTHHAVWRRVRPVGAALRRPADPTEEHD